MQVTKKKEKKFNPYDHPGTVWPNTFKKGECESGIDGIKDGDLFWTVCTEKGGGFDTTNPDSAEIIARLVLIENRQKEMEKTLIETAKVILLLGEKELEKNKGVKKSDRRK